MQACIHCGDIQERASCDACCEWNDPTIGAPGVDDNDPSAPADLDPAPGRRLLFAVTTTARQWLDEDWRRDAEARAWSAGLLEK